MKEPIICFGQQPNGFLPKRFLVAKIRTAQKLQKDIGGKIVYFFHDSDADYRETVTLLRDSFSQAEVRLNFTQENRIQKKFSPLYLKRVHKGWTQEIVKQLPRFFSPPEQKQLAEIFMSVQSQTAGDFCLEMYQKLGLLEGLKVVRSSDRNFRSQAKELVEDFYADLEFEGEVVRAKIEQQKDGPVGVLHEGGNKFIRFPVTMPIEKFQKSAGRDQRFAWMNSVVNCTHYIWGEGEQQYLNPKNFSTVQFVDREKIDQANFAWFEGK